MTEASKFFTDSRSVRDVCGGILWDLRCGSGPVGKTDELLSKDME